MHALPIFYREIVRPPRFVTWPLAMIGAGAVASAGREFHDTTIFVLVVLAGALSTIVLLEFVAVAVVVTQVEVRFGIWPFYQRRMEVADIQHWEVRTYPGPGNDSNRFGHYRGFWIPPNHCVELLMTNGAQFSITSAHPEHLSHAISKAKGIVPAHEVPSTAVHHHHA